MEIDLSKNVDAMKKDELQKFARQLIGHIKGQTKKETKADEIAVDYPYEAVGVVGNKLVTLKFDLETKEARVIDVSVDSRDTRGQNHMATYKSIERIKELAKKQKEIKNEEN